ncbi:hypothetical protein AGMMS49546_15230 [Spirochaetia bacterium]|nr:hypothetical protein AGMMS49546_15230 [Spirochaetia bacterium]
MEIAVLADIHGNLIALEAVLKDIEENKIDQIIVLGDMITDFPDDTNTILNMIKQKAQYIIKGNRETYLLSADMKFREYKQFLSISKTYDAISSDNLKFISSLPEQISIVYDSSFSFDQWYKKINDKIIVNPGSAGINFSGSKTAQYAIINYENGIASIVLKDVVYDFERLKSKYNQNNSWQYQIMFGMIYAKNGLKINDKDEHG